MNIQELITLHLAFEYKEIYLMIEAKAQELGVLERKLQPLIVGKELITLGLTPSPEFSHILQKVYEAQMNGEFITKNDGIKYVKKLLNI